MMEKWEIPSILFPYNRTCLFVDDGIPSEHIHRVVAVGGHYGEVVLAIRVDRAGEDDVH